MRRVRWASLRTALRWMLAAHGGEPVSVAVLQQGRSMTSNVRFGGRVIDRSLRAIHSGQRSRALRWESLEKRALLTAAPNTIVDEAVVECVVAQEVQSAATQPVQAAPVAIEPVKPGDADLSGVVDFLDHQIWSEHYLKPGSWSFLDGDFTLDGMVDMADYTVWADNFGLPASAAAQPVAAAVPAELASAAKASAALLDPDTVIDSLAVLQSTESAASKGNLGCPADDLKTASLAAKTLHGQSEVSAAPYAATIDEDPATVRDETLGEACDWRQVEAVAQQLAFAATLDPLFGADESAPLEIALP